MDGWASEVAASRSMDAPIERSLLKLQNLALMLIEFTPIRLPIWITIGDPILMDITSGECQPARKSSRNSAEILLQTFKLDLDLSLTDKKKIL